MMRDRQPTDHMNIHSKWFTRFSEPSNIDSNTTIAQCRKLIELILKHPMIRWRMVENTVVHANEFMADKIFMHF